MKIASFLLCFFSARVVVMGRNIKAGLNQGRWRLARRNMKPVHESKRWRDDIRLHARVEPTRPRLSTAGFYVCFFFFDISTICTCCSTPSCRRLWSRVVLCILCFVDIHFHTPQHSALSSKRISSRGDGRKKKWRIANIQEIISNPIMCSTRKLIAAHQTSVSLCFAAANMLNKPLAERVRRDIILEFLPLLMTRL